MVSLELGRKLREGMEAAGPPQIVADWPGPAESRRCLCECHGGPPGGPSPAEATQQAEDGGICTDTP